MIPGMASCIPQSKDMEKRQEASVNAGFAGIVSVRKNPAFT
jgi:hypothetical protein